MPSLGCYSSNEGEQGMAAFVSVKREKDIVKKCERLERLKHDLNRELLLSFKWAYPPLFAQPLTRLRNHAKG